MTPARSQIAGQASIRDARMVFGSLEFRTWFWQQARQEGDCLIWTKAMQSPGYGVLRVGHRNLLAHRASWLLTNGDIQPGLCVLHRCDNPACIDPDHLFLGTRTDNSIDKIKKGRQGRGDKMAHKGATNGRAKLNDEQVLLIRKIYREGGVTHRELAKEFGVAHSLIGRIVLCLAWRHLVKAGEQST